MLPRVEPDRVEDERGRQYRTPAGLLPSVTTLLGATREPEHVAALDAWRARVGPEEAERVSQDARDRGTRLHARIEAWADDPFLAVEEDPADPWWNSVVPFLRTIEQVILVESAVWHPEAGFAGTLDMLARIRPGLLVLIDWKTGTEAGAHLEPFIRRRQTQRTIKAKRVEWIGDYLLQGGAYVAALERMHPGLRLDAAAVVIAYETRFADVFWMDRDDLGAAWADFQRRLRRFRRGIA